MNLWPTGKNNEILSAGHPLELVVGHLLPSHQPRGSSCGRQWTVPLEPTAGEGTSAHPCCPTGHCARQISSEERSLSLPRPRVLCLVPSPTPQTHNYARSCPRRKRLWDSPASGRSSYMARGTGSVTGKGARKTSNFPTLPGCPPSGASLPLC